MKEPREFPREFWINRNAPPFVVEKYYDDETPVLVTPSSFIHVIEKSAADELAEALEKTIFALQCMIIKFNGPCPGLTSEQVFSAACDTRDFAKDTLKKYRGEEQE